MFSTSNVYRDKGVGYEHMLIGGGWGGVGWAEFTSIWVV